MFSLCITFDYELFFGENKGSYDEVLFDYTYKLIDALDKKGISATFFADVCSIPVSKEYGQDAYIQGFEKQIRYMASHGQDVQLHLHPHWFYSKWEDGQWKFSNKGYRLHEFEDQRLNQIISDGKKLLEDIIRPINPQYDCIAYRAGGFSIQPHERIVKALWENGIRVDSSVAVQLAAESDAQVYDYKHSVVNGNWYISSDRAWWEDVREGCCLYEIPIATIDKNPLSFLVKRILHPDAIKLNLGPKRGSYIPIDLKTGGKLASYWNYISGYNAISMDAYNADFLYSQVKRLYKKNGGTDQAAAIIGHPKLVTEKYIDNLCRFIDIIAGDTRFAFISVYDAYMKEKEK